MKKLFIPFLVSFILFRCSVFDSSSKDNDLQNILLVIVAARANETSLSGEAATFQQLVNDHRSKNTSCESLREYTPLHRNAQNHSNDMLNRNFFNHNNPDGKSPFDRMRDDGIAYDRAGENIASGQRTAQAVLDAWLNSPGHRANIENCQYTHNGIGLAISENRYLWTHVFARNPRPL